MFEFWLLKCLKFELIFYSSTDVKLYKKVLHPKKKGGNLVTFINIRIFTLFFYRYVGKFYFFCIFHNFIILIINKVLICLIALFLLKCCFVDINS